MLVTTRRLVLAAAGTVAAALLARKPRAGDLRDLSGLVPESPPKTLPDFGFVDEAGRTRSLADYKGRGVVLNFWATWCMPCVEELPSLDALARRLAGRDVAVLALSSDRGGAKAVQAFYAGHGIRTLPVLLDDGMKAGHVLGLRGIPTTLLIDRAGRERARFEGSADWASDASAARVADLVGGRSPETNAT